MSNKTYVFLLIVLSLVVFAYGVRAMRWRHSNTQDPNTDIRQVYVR